MGAVGTGQVVPTAEIHGSPPCGTQVPGANGEVIGVLFVTISAKGPKVNDQLSIVP
ncbi:MAG: hypothetical protein U0T81_18260 [Saprospiraceae bacterium]